MEGSQVIAPWMWLIRRGYKRNGNVKKNGLERLTPNRAKNRKTTISSDDG